jgi:hypothetical protein
MTDTGADEPTQEFSELLEVVQGARAPMQGLLRTVARDVSDDDVYRAAILVTEEAVPPAVAAAVAEIANGQHAPALLAHHLSNSDGAWTLKYLEIQRARERMDALPVIADDPKPRLRRGRWWLKKLNVVLGSLADAIPAGGVLKELKEATESTVETALDEG